MKATKHLKRAHDLMTKLNFGMNVDSNVQPNVEPNVQPNMSDRFHSILQYLQKSDGINMQNARYLSHGKWGNTYKMKIEIEGEPVDSDNIKVDLHVITETKTGMITAFQTLSGKKGGAYVEKGMAFVQFENKHELLPIAILNVLTEDTIVIKEFTKKERYQKSNVKERGTLAHEVAVLKDIHTRLKSHFQHFQEGQLFHRSDTKQLVMVSPYYGPVVKDFNNYSLMEIFDCIKQLLFAVGKLHLQNIAHGDLYPSSGITNFCYNNGHLTLIDFGLGASPEASHSVSSTMLYDFKKLQHLIRAEVLDKHDRVVAKNNIHKTVQYELVFGSVKDKNIFAFIQFLMRKVYGVNQKVCTDAYYSCVIIEPYLNNTEAFIARLGQFTLPYIPITTYDIY